ncbi:MAG: sigma-70 family RNA polymerase sigma factor [Acidobacteriota bacterium]|nr:sigma-70 family RNA polymerase sigma factor [Acidobacteriota bacterium]
MNGDRFRTTQWSLVLSAREHATTESRQALARLCEAYWAPLYAFVRRQGYDVDDARDLTQGYFCVLIDKAYLADVDPRAGRFRSFLLASLKHHLSHERERERAKKRGGGTIHLSFDVELAEKRYRDAFAEQVTAETMYERRWAQTLLERTKDRLRKEFEERGKRRHYELLKSHLTGGSGESTALDAATELGTSEGNVRVTVHRMRRRFGELLREEVAQTVADPAHVEDELRHLLTVVAEDPV